MKIKKLTAFVLTDIILGLMIVAALGTALFLMLQNNSNVSMSAASCSVESELYGHAVACGNVLMSNSGTQPSCAEIADCVVNQAALTSKWPNLTNNSGNLSIGDSGIDGVADNEVECSGSPATLTVNCTDDRVGGAPAAAGASGGSCTPLPPPLNVDNDCDGVDEDCLNGADDGYVSSGSCQVANTNPACPAEEVTGSYICQSGSEVCDDLGQVATCPPTCTPTGSPDTNCDGVDDDCNGTADDGYVSTSCQVANTNATCPTEEVTGSTSCVAGSVVCDDLGQVATCPSAGASCPCLDLAQLISTYDALPDSGGNAGSLIVASPINLNISATSVSYTESWNGSACCFTRGVSIDVTLTGSSLVCGGYSQGHYIEYNDYPTWSSFNTFVYNNSGSFLTSATQAEREAALADCGQILTDFRAWRASNGDAF